MPRITVTSEPAGVVSTGVVGIAGATCGIIGCGLKLGIGPELRTGTGAPPPPLLFCGLRLGTLIKRLGYSMAGATGNCSREFGLRIVRFSVPLELAATKRSATSGVAAKKTRVLPAGCPGLGVAVAPGGGGGAAGAPALSAAAGTGEGVGVGCELSGTVNRQHLQILRDGASDGDVFRALKNLLVTFGRLLFQRQIVCRDHVHSVADIDQTCCRRSRINVNRDRAQAVRNDEVGRNDALQRFRDEIAGDGFLSANRRAGNLPRRFAADR